MNARTRSRNSNAPVAKPLPLIQMEMRDALLAVTTAYGEALDRLAQLGIGHGAAKSPTHAMAQHVLLRTK